MISSQTARIKYTVTDLADTYVVPFYFLADADLVVVITDEDGVDGSPLVLNTDYTVAGEGVEAGGTITLTSAAAAVDESVTIYRGGDLVQPAEYPTSGQFPSATTEQSQDRLTMLVQQLQLDVARAIRVPVTNDELDPLTIAGRASKVVGFDSDGNLTYYSVVAGSIVPQSVQGTANQVLVNGGSGSAVTGAVVLTLPQSIGTASIPQFAGLNVGHASDTTIARLSAGVLGLEGVTILTETSTTTAQPRFAKLGINGSLVANSDITVTRSLPNATAQASVVVTGALTPPAATDLHPNAFRDTTTFTPTAAGDAYCSYDAQASVGGAVALNHFHGYQSRHGFTGSGTLGIMSGYATTNMGLSGLGTITFLRGLYVSQPTIAGGGTVGQFDGIYMDALSNSTGLVNAIYIAGANNVFMAGGQFGNSALLTYPAGATTCRGYFTFNQTSQTGLAVMNSNATATGTMISFCRDGGSVQGSITQVNNTTVAYNTSSDRRLKENFRPITDSGAIVDSITPWLYDWKNGQKDFHGFIAQDLHEDYPDAVTPGTDELTPDGHLMHPWSYDPGKLVPLLFAEVKDLRRRLVAAGIAA